MTELSWAGYGGIFVATTLLTLVLVPLMLKLAVRLQVLDRPDESHSYKSQTLPIPYLGGVAIVVSFSAAVLLAALLRPPISGLPELFTIIAAAVGLSMLGLIDDLRGLTPWLRMLAVLAAAGAVYAAGVRVQLFNVVGLDAALTIIWIAGITNALNLLDNMDGLSAGVTAICSAAFFLIAAVNDQFLVAALAVGLLGCALGFLRSNFHPARIYMGDAGSLFLGFVLAVLGVKLRFDAPRNITALVPILVLGVPLFDTTLVVLTRLAARRSPFQGGRDHASHRLVRVGIPVPAAVGLIYGAAIGLGWLALVTSRLRDASTAYLLFGFVAAGGLFLGLLLAAVPVHAGSRRRHLALQQVAEAEPGAASRPVAAVDPP